MIESFTLTNYGSFDKPTTIEFSPGRSRGKNQHISENDCLKVCAIYGANAAGKSNFIRGLRTLKDFVTNNLIITPEPINNWYSDSKITTFDITIDIENKQYSYHLSVECNGSRRLPNSMILLDSYYYTVVEEELYSTILTPDSTGKLPEPELIFKNRCANKDHNEKMDSLLISNVELQDKVKDLKQQQNSFDEEISDINAQINQYYKRIEELNDKYSDMPFTFDGDVIGDIPEDADEDHINAWNECCYLERTELALRDDIERLSEKKNKTDEQIHYYLKQIEGNRQQINALAKIDDSAGPLLSQLYKREQKGLVKSKFEAWNSVLNWFNSSLIILDTYDFHLPIDRPNLLSDISEILKPLDIGIDNLHWVELNADCDKNEIDVVKGLLTEGVANKLEGCRESSIKNQCLSSKIIKSDEGEFYLFNYYMGDLSISKLMAYHDKGKRISYDLSIESDGTRRLIELCSILLNTDKDRVFIVDELDRRLHPLLTRRFIELYLQDESKYKQLIFTTHETRILTTDLFRMDEIWFVDKRDGESVMSCLSDLSVNYNKRIDNMYLSGELKCGIPHIGNTDE